jgi:histidyl-tRNA synthetase
MTEQQPFRPKARLPRGFRDRGEAEIAAERRMLDTIRGVYESYGFQALETATLEYADALGKFLPDQDRPNEGVFSFADDDGQWLSLRYDLTAPLARYVAEHWQTLPKPFRRYQTGTVWRNEKPGPGRYREFTQFDADTVGSASPAADAELLMMLADTLEALGLKRGDYIVKVNSRKLLDGVLEAAGVARDRVRRGIVLRAIDKLDRLGTAGVRALLGPGRKDESGDFTKGAELSLDQIARVVAFVSPENPGADTGAALAALASAVAGSATGEEGIAALREIVRILNMCGYGPERVRVDSGIVRGLDYYTGAVYEAQLTFPVANEAGETVVFGSVGGGGRYDDLVARFTGQSVPAAGFSIGVSRLLTALRAREGAEGFGAAPLVIVLSLGDAAAAFKTAHELRAALNSRDQSVRVEAYAGTKRFGDQLKYADKRGAAVAVIEGEDERNNGNVTIKDLKRGAETAEKAKDVDRASYLGMRASQVTVERSALVSSVRDILFPKGG